MDGRYRYQPDRAVSGYESSSAIDEAWRDSRQQSLYRCEASVSWIVRLQRF